MHKDEIDVTKDIVKALVSSQFPQYLDLPLVKMDSPGTNNALFKLGDEMIVRLPIVVTATKHVEVERAYLPKLAPLLPVDVPIPLGLGNPSDTYPWQWTIYRRLKGDNPQANKLERPEELARDIAQFISAMRDVDSTGGPKAKRGKDLSNQDPGVQHALKNLKNTVDTVKASKIWKKCLKAKKWQTNPVWVHGDLMPGNLLVIDGRLSGVLDFEGTGVGDPACDLIPAWNLLPGSVRSVFKDTVGVDKDTWLRGMGWAFSMALIQLPYYRGTNPAMATNARHVIAEVINQS